VILESNLRAFGVWNGNWLFRHNGEFCKGWNGVDKGVKGFSFDLGTRGFRRIRPNFPWGFTKKNVLVAREIMGFLSPKGRFTLGGKKLVYKCAVYTTPNGFCGAKSREGGGFFFLFRVGPPESVWYYFLRHNPRPERGPRPLYFCGGGHTHLNKNWGVGVPPPP